VPLVSHNGFCLVHYSFPVNAFQNIILSNMKTIVSLKCLPSLTEFRSNCSILFDSQLVFFQGQESRVSPMTHICKGFKGLRQDYRDTEVRSSPKSDKTLKSLDTRLSIFIALFVVQVRQN